MIWRIKMNKKVREYLEWQLINANDSLGKEIITNIIQDLEMLDFLTGIIKEAVKEWLEEK